MYMGVARNLSSTSKGQAEDLGYITFSFNHRLWMMSSWGKLFDFLSLSLSIN